MLGYYREYRVLCKFITELMNLQILKEEKRSNMKHLNNTVKEDTIKLPRSNGTWECFPSQSVICYCWWISAGQGGKKKKSIGTCLTCNVTALVTYSDPRLKNTKVEVILTTDTSFSSWPEESHHGRKGWQNTLQKQMKHWKNTHQSQTDYKKENMIEQKVKLQATYFLRTKGQLNIKDILRSTKVP